MKAEAEKYHNELIEKIVEQDDTAMTTTWMERFQNRDSKKS
jgi:hypothetical protein